MKAGTCIYIHLAIISVIAICSEIIAIHTLSVTFVYGYASILLSVAILGLGWGGKIAHYRIKTNDTNKVVEIVTENLMPFGVLLFEFITIITPFKSIENPVFNLSFQFIPFYG
ncbi:hypothetical protein JW960_08570 [candidate division KSB1 bacterium]|nr:hypothetical protein [candidate division KSB1 bacterium]